jgi:hypothetical protein
VFFVDVPGRGALEIDILEVLPGSYGPNYKKDKADAVAMVIGDDWEITWL